MLGEIEILTIKTCTFDIDLHKLAVIVKYLNQTQTKETFDNKSNL